MHLGGLDFLSIRLVVLCAELGCLSAAARACNITLSTASHRLTNLEKVFDTRFFRRHYLGLQPTQAGAVFSSHAREILLTMYAVERQLQALPAPKM
jgi:DNA-binding transcriptional LysR family regulator